MVNFSTKLPFPPSFFPRSFPRPAVALERIIPRYELGIYNYTGAVIGFSSFFFPFLPSLPHSRPPFSENIARFRVSLYIGKPINKSPGSTDGKVPNYSSRSSERARGRRCPAKGKSESASLDIALTGVTIVTPRPRAKWPILLK